jgi:hypothetical protein
MVDPFRRIQTLNPTTRGGSLVEVWFSLMEGQAIHRGTFGSVNELHTKIRPASTVGTTAATSSRPNRRPDPHNGGAPESLRHLGREIPDWARGAVTVTASAVVDGMSGVRRVLR